MKIENIINLIKAYFYENWQKDLIYNFLIIFCFGFFSPFMTGSFGVIFMAACILILLYPKRVFGNLYQNSSRLHYLTIPASNGEKVTAAMILTNVYYVLGVLISAALGLALGLTIAKISGVSDLGFPDYWPVLKDSISNNGSMITGILGFFLAISVVFFACIYFKKNPIGKMFGVLIILGIITIIVLGLILKINELFAVPTEILKGSYSRVETGVTIYDNTIIDSIIYAAGIVYFYVLSFIRMRETEA